MRRVVILAFPDVQSLDVAGPLEVFHAAGAYSTELVAPGGAAFSSSSGLRLTPDGPLPRGSIDTLVVAGGVGVREALKERELLAWLRDAAARSRRVTSVCTGAFLLAQAGLLDGRRATTHWNSCSLLARRYPAVTVERDPIFVRDGNVYTSAGVTAGIDLALALVEDDLGADVAREIARRLVLFLKRPGGQSQFSAQLASEPAERSTLRELQSWIPANLTGDLSVNALAERAFMSPRNFARAFRAETGMTPATYVELVRVERARMLLEAGTAPGLAEIARRCGFGTVETLRRAFRRRVGVSPSDYRERFRPSLKEAA